MQPAFNRFRFTSDSIYGRHAARDEAIAELRLHGWAPGLPFTLAELGALETPPAVNASANHPGSRTLIRPVPKYSAEPPPAVSAEETAACLGVRAFFYRALEGGQPVAIVAVFRAGAADPSSALSLVAQRLGLTADVMRVERVWLAVYRRRGTGEGGPRLSAG